MDFFKIHKKETIISIILILLLIALSIYVYKSTNYTDEEITKLVDTSFDIEIKGEIKHPGIYQAKENYIIQDIIKMAGGLTENADITNINLEEKISKYMTINIPSINKINQTNKISLNNSDLTTLQTLPGIGQTKAQAIIDYRNTNGNFKTIEEITNVPGIGPSTYENIKEFISP